MKACSQEDPEKQFCRPAGILSCPKQPARLERKVSGHCLQDKDAQGSGSSSGDHPKQGHFHDQPCPGLLGLHKDV